ncbi:MAG TPA: arylamine N-acetyltransferase [Pseudolabrys sp.]
MIDLTAYFKRVGYGGAAAPTLATLRELHRLQPQAIAFENLDPLLKRPVRLDAASLERKLLHGGRGGYCYEQNLLFAHVLRAIGFNVTELAGRVLWNVPPGRSTPRVHMLLLVDIGGERYLADAGFGGNVLTSPLLLDETAEQATAHEPFQVIKEDERYTLQFKLRDTWFKLYRFDLSEQILPDHEQGNWYVSTHPQSIFVNGLMAGRAEPGRRYALGNNQLSIHMLDGATEKRTLTNVTEMRDALTDLFKLRLAGLDGLDAALARLTGG